MARFWCVADDIRVRRMKMVIAWVLCNLYPGKKLTLTIFLVDFDQYHFELESPEFEKFP